ncbi:hypothetical protein C1I98_01110 [Spongiactinospora gelatinilytica]|uniref:Uncharacterized protein n=1 Tax=Spongiactinospora gelatinilytica TaxID=2666298 RepID=A0A2W2H7K8_9ACTN|nr:hypothetical protein [Spongiactinospora gelatinilytica]PZG56671.1 hypothetical protein C1I98_01110 [Spongiactinospora gelatinilytica]
MDVTIPMGSLPPPITCIGCERQIHQPYGAQDLKFTYRIGESLRRVLEKDSLGHILALAWLIKIFAGRGLVGAHPGVTFIDSASGGAVGEADVLLLFADGSLVPVEVKRSAGGFDEDGRKRLDALSDLVGAHFDIVAVTQPARECEPLAD